MLKKMTRARLIQAWFTAVVFVVVAGVAMGATVTLGTGALLLALCLVPPAVTLMLWHKTEPVTAGDVIRGERR